MALTIILQLYFPDGIGAADLLPRLSQKGVVVAGGLHTSIKGASFRYVVVSIR
jgi:alanine-glyoxylate transaminase / serine-glyoxylate transaminase / serine-pyruvate transaminase